MLLTKYDRNPVMSPKLSNGWESLVTTNPGAWFDEEKHEVIMLYRAAGDDTKHRISIGLAVSKNGYDFDRLSDQPVFSPSLDGWDAGGVEDPRIVKFGDFYFITYAAVSSSPGRYWENGGNRHVPSGLPAETPLAVRDNKTRTGLVITKDFETYKRVGYITDPMFDDRDVIIFPEKINGKFATLHRPAEWVGEKYNCEKASIWIALSDDLLEHKKLHLLAQPIYDWEFEKIGGAAPPIKTEAGWLMLYHGVDRQKKYRVGAMLLDIHDPTVVTHRTSRPILEPEYYYENEGIYEGICFPCGNVVIDGVLFVYYGGADKYVGVATCPVDYLIEYIRKFPVE